MSSSESDYSVQKTPFTIKQDCIGPFLKIHHTIKTVDGQIKRIRFRDGCFSHNKSLLIALDHRSNIYVFDLKSLLYWVLPERVQHSIIIRSVPSQTQLVIIGTKQGQFILVNIYKNEIVTAILPFSCPIRDITFPRNRVSSGLFIGRTKYDAKIFRISDLMELDKLEFNSFDLTIKQLDFKPKSETIFACFDDDSIHLWTNRYKLMRRIFPMKLKKSYLNISKPVETLNIDTELNDTVFETCDLRDSLSCGNILSVCFSPDGKMMIVTTKDNYLIIIGTITWTILKLIRIIDQSFVQCSFINREFFLIGLTQLKKLYLINLDNLQMKLLIQDESVYRYHLSNDGDYLGVILETGEILYYHTSNLLRLIKKHSENIQIIKTDRTKNAQVNIKMDNEIRSVLTHDRLLTILREFGEYPKKYRAFIWRSILDLPLNIQEISELYRKGDHSCVKNVDKMYPLKSSSTLKHLKKVISCLANWCIVFSSCEYLPKFIFPFLRIFEYNVAVSFEVVATILYNQCQLWFEFAPLEPFNYLGMIHNLMLYYCKSLIDFYNANNITAKEYALPLMETAFSEVLDEDQWLQLWDNIITQPPHFMVFCIVAYNFIQMNVIKQLTKSVSIKSFFYEQNTVNIKKVICKAIEMVEQCPDELNPSKYMHEFRPLSKDGYPKFENYPKILMDLKEKELNILQTENELLESKISELSELAKSINMKYDEIVSKEEHEKRLQEVEKIYEEALLREEERVCNQRKQLICFQRDLRLKESEILEGVRSSTNRYNLLTKKNELDTLLRSMHRNKIRDETDMLYAEEDLRIKELKLLTEKYNLERALTEDIPFSERYQDIIRQLEIERSRLQSELAMIKKDSICGQDSLKESTTNHTSKITTMEELLLRYHAELNELYMKSEKTNTDRIKINKMQATIELVEKELRDLIMKMTS